MPESGKYSVLYVDDEPGLLEIGKIFLEATDEFSVGTTESADEALRILSSGSFDAVVSDYQMPGMDGIAFLKEVRVTYSEIPFILFTGRGREDVVIDAINNGADFYLQKGGDPEAQFAELANKIRYAVRHRRTRKSLRQNEARLRQIIDLVPQMIYAKDSNGTFLLANRATAEGYNTTVAALEGKAQAQFHPDAAELQRMLADDREVMATGTPKVISEEEYLDANGRHRVLTTTKVPFTTSDGNRQAVLGVSTDITELRRAGDAVKKTEERFRLAMDAINDGIWDWDLIADNSYFSPGYYQMLGYEPGAFPATGKMWETLIHPDDREYVLLKNQDCIENRCKNFEIEYRMKAADGSWRWILGRGKAVSRDASGRAVRMIGTHVDLTGRKNAEDALREGEAKYRLLIENTHDIIYTLSTDGKFHFVSPRATPLLGYQVPDLVGKSFRAFIHPDDLLVCEDAFRRTIAGIPQPYFEYRFRHADGSWRWYSSNSVSLNDKKGNVTGYEGIASDITQRKNAEEALRESEAKYRLLIENSHDIIYTLSPDGVFLYVSPSWTKLLGHPVDEVVGRSFRPFIHPEDLPVCEEAVRKTIREGIPQPYFEYRVRHADGSWRWNSSKSVPLRNGDGNITGFEGIASDITGRKNADEALRESEAKYRRILENMQDAYLQTDNDGTITLANPAAARLYGFGSAGELIGQPVASLYVSPEIRRATIQKLQDGKITDFTGLARRKDGSFVPVSLNIQFRSDENGRRLGTEAIVRDITLRKMMEHSMTEASRKLNLLNSITRHDIVNQVSILRGFAQIAHAKEQDTGVKEFLIQIDDVGARIGRQIAFTKTYQELGMHSPYWQKACDLLPKDIPKGIAFSCPCKDIEIYADPMLAKVFGNLLDNSIRHGGGVTQITISCEETGKCLTIQWNDDGCGIPDAEKEKIFERGFGKHTGYGLFFAREILAITGMTIRETGKQGSGAQFTIEVPEGHWREGAGSVPDGS